MLNEYLKQTENEANTALDMLLDIMKDFGDDFDEEAVIEELETEKDRKAIWDAILNEPEEKEKIV